MNFQQGGLSSILKDGTKHLSGLEQSVIRNIEAVKKLSEITRTSMGPYGMNKMVINHLDKLFVTHDAVTMLQQLEVIHPAANIAVLSTISQEQEIGDGTNFVITLTGELLRQSETLIKLMRLHPSDIRTGYKKALKKALEVLEDNVVCSVSDIFSKKEVYKAMKSGITSKQYGREDTLIPLIMEACMNVYKPLVDSFLKRKKKRQPNFNVENVRVVGIPGGSLGDSFVIKGFVLDQNVENSIKHVKKAIIAVYACNVDTTNLDTKETVLIKNDKELLNYSKSEEEEIEKDIKAIASAGVNVIITKGSFGEMALHFIEKYKIMAIKCTSKFELRRLCRSCGATPLVRLGKPVKEELGYCDDVDLIELGSKKMIHFKQTSISLISTIVLRGATSKIIKEIERCVNDGINIYRILTKDSRLVAGAGAIEMEIYKSITDYAESISGMDQYSIRKFAEAFLVIPKTLAESSGLNLQSSISNLIAKHEKGNKYWGVDLDSKEGKDVVKDKSDQILDRYKTKYWGIKFATDAVLSILSIDQIIMARPSGGPKAPSKVKRELELMKK